MEGEEAEERNQENANKTEENGQTDNNAESNVKSASKATPIDKNKNKGEIERARLESCKASLLIMVLTQGFSEAYPMRTKICLCTLLMDSSGFIFKRVKIAFSAFRNIHAFVPLCTRDPVENCHVLQQACCFEYNIGELVGIWN